ncbi:MAG TPA: glycosyltransferase family 87 protein [Candidatus Binataceae bacterium]
MALAIPFLTRRHSEWEAVYVAAARRLRTQGDLYTPADGYLYPPFMALAAIPFTWIPRWLGRAIWYAMSVAAMTYMVKTSWRLAGGVSLEELRLRRDEHLAFAAGLLTALGYFINCFNHQQTDLVSGALVIAGCGRLAAGAPLAAAGWIGIAAAMKCTPLLWVAYFAWHRALVAAGMVAAVAIGLNLLPELMRPGRHPGLLVQWVRSFGLIPARLSIAPGIWGSAMFYNQSLSGAVGRFGLTRLIPSAGGFATVPRAAALSAPMLKVIAYGLEAALLAATFAVQRGPQRREEPGISVPAISVESGAMLALMPLLSPMSSPPHFALLILPGFCAARLGLIEGRRRAVMLLLIAIACSISYPRILTGSTVHDLAMWFGVVGWGALALLAACDLELASRRSAAARA